MRILLALLVACGGGKPPPPVSNSTPVAATPAPAPESASRCGCTSEVCRGDNETKYALAKMCTYAMHMCDCKDKACADGVQADLTRWGEDMAKNAASSKPARMDEADAKRMVDHSTKYSECYAKLVTPATP